MRAALSLSLVLLIILIISQGVHLKKWEVTLTHDYICAVIGSSVVMPCTFTHPSRLTVTKVYWIINATHGGQTTDISTETQYKDRVQYSTDKKTNCTLTLSDVRLTDKALYYARIETKTAGEKWQSQSVHLTVKELFVQISESAVEGKQVKLSCKSNCTLKQNSKIMWRKDGKTLPQTQTNSNDLILPNIRIEDEGDYSCALEGQKNPSPPVKLNVMYPPKNTSVSISPAGEILTGASVTLTCSSDANPPVENYTWFKGNETMLKGTGKIFKITQITPADSGYYYCWVKNEVGDRTSADVYLNVQYAPQNTLASVSPSGEIVEGTSVTLSCSSDANPPVQSYTWYKRSGSGMSKISTQQVYNISRVSSEDTGYYYCQAENKHGHTDSTEVHLNVLYPPKIISASLNYTVDLKEGSSVTLRCSSDANPPVENYTWYRRTGNETTAVGSGETITFTLTSTTAGLYHCEAKNRIGNTSASVKVFLTVSRGQGVAAIAGGAAAFSLVVIVILAVILSRRRKTASNSTGDSVRRTQAAADNDYINVNPVTSDPIQSADADDPDDVQYASVQFTSSRGQQVPPHSTAQRSSPPRPHNHQAMEEVEYAAVNFSGPTAATNTSADTDLYSTVNKPRR